MGKKVVARISFFIVLNLLCTQLSAQVSFESQEELEKAANAFFEAKEYTKAKPLFSQLLSKDAMNPNYNYRFGTCMMFTEADPLKPLPYIEGGAGSKGVNPEAHYFLGRSYQFNYRFEDAIASFEKGKSSGFNTPGIDLNRSIEECRNGKLLYNASIDFKPALDKEVLASEFYRPYDFRKLKGKVIPMPPNFKTKYDEKNLIGTVIYTPTSSEVLIYASYGEDGTNAKDLYRVNRLPSGEWALPQRLPSSINTKYDEDFAFYDEQAQTLFFASKGHNTMGGYDIFTSKYAADANTWSSPVNLQYPINSPFDDFLYVSDDEGKEAFFTTARQTGEGKLRVYKTLLHDPAQVELTMVEGTYDDLTDSIFNYMTATVLDPRTNEVIGKYRSHKETGKYLLILPPQNDYVMNVGPREAEGFKFDLDIPAHRSVEALQQSVAYEAVADQGTLQVINYFDASGKPDTVIFSQNLPSKELNEKMVQMLDPGPVHAARKQSDPGQDANLKAEALAAEKAKAEELDRREAEALAVEKERIAREQALLAEKEKEELAERLKAEAQEQALAQQNAKDEEQKLKAEAEQAAEKIRAEAEAKEQALAQQKAKEEEQKMLAEAEQASEKMKAEAEAKEQALAQQKAKEEEQKMLAEAEQASEKMKAEAEAKEQALAQQKAKEEEQKMLAEAEQASEKMKAEAEAKEQALAQQKAEEEEQKMLAEAEELAQRLSDVALVVANDQEPIAKKAEEDSLARVALLQAKNEREKLEWIELHASAKKQQMADQAKRDSVEAVRIESERLKSDQLAVQKAKKDSLAREELRTALAESERKRLAEIEREAQNAKQIALKDSVDLLSTNEEEALKALSEKKSAEIAINAEKQKGQLEVDAELDPKRNAGQPPENGEPVVEVPISSEAPSDSELFLATLAKLEAQKLEQDRLIAQENEERAQKKEATKTEVDAPAIGTKNEVVASKDLGSASENVSTDRTAKENADRKVAALKSDADPTDFLAELNRVEAEIKQEAADRPDKSYELRPLEPVNELTQTDVSSDQVLKKSIENDRSALAEHQKIALEKERLMNEQMERDKQAIGRSTVDAASEIEAIENEALLALEVQQNVITDTQKAAPIAVEPVSVSPIAPAKQEPAEVALVQELDQEFEDLLKTIEEPKPVVQTLDSKPVNAETVPAAELVDQKPAEARSDEKVQIASEVNQPVVPQELVVAITEPSDQPKVNAEVNAQDGSVDPTEELQKEIEAEFAELSKEVNIVGTQPIVVNVQEVEQVGQVRVEEPTSETPEDKKEIEAQLSVLAPSILEDGIGQIHFMKPALRHPLATKPDFENIIDDQTRKMIKRMRAEDIGRIAVLKTMKNQWVDAGRSAEALTGIKAKLRNQDVLENTAVVLREETVRTPFDRNDLKERQNVSYKLQLKLSTTPVSETILETMLPEMAVSFNMPEVELTTDHFKTLADATSGFYEYRNRGFDKVSIVPYHNGQPVLLSDVQDVPFVD